MDYYVYELGRLRDLVKTEALVVFNEPPELAAALAKFERAIPHLQRIRNSLTHFDDTDRLNRLATFVAAVDLEPDGGVTYLVDPRHAHHQAALNLSEALVSYLCSLLQDSISQDPPAPIAEQIRRRERPESRRN